MSILLAFVPFLTFALLEHRLGVAGALLAATAVSALLVIRDTVIKKKSLKILEAGSLVLFGALALASRLPTFHPSILMVRVYVDGGLLAIVLASILIGRPFTLQYAQEQVPPEIAATPRFKTINVQLSSAWGLAFAVMVAADAAMIYAPGFTPLLGTVVILAAMAGAALVTVWLPKAAARRAAA